MIRCHDILTALEVPIREKWGYIFGKWGQTWTAANQRNIEKTTSAKYATARKYGSRWIGHRVSDCSGLIRWLLSLFDVKIQHSSNAIWKEYCKKQGKLMNGKRADGYILRPGSCVFLCDKTGNRHHVGMYRGDGICVEAKGTRYGVVESPITHWDEWGELKSIDYSEYPETKVSDPMNPTLRKGDRGEDVKRMQTLLNQFGYKLKVDGNFGSGTDKAVREFQKASSLKVDGVCGPKTWAALGANNMNIGGEQNEDIEDLQESDVKPVEPDDNMEEEYIYVSARELETMQIEAKNIVNAISLLLQSED